MKLSKQLIPIALIGVATLSLVGCNQKNDMNMSKTIEEVMDMKPSGGVNLENLDLTTSPKEDFYQYANGGWQSKTVIPDDESRWGSFNELREINDSMTLALVDKALQAKSIDNATDEGKVVQFFNAAMNTSALNKEGVAPIQKYLTAINNISSKDDVLQYIIDTEPILGGLIGSGVRSDAKNSNVNALYLGGGNLGLPDRDYYILQDDDSEKIRRQYLAHVTKMLQFLDYSESEAALKAKNILALETKLAESMLDKVERRNPSNTYNPKTMAELQSLAPAINWEKYYNGIGAKNFDKIIVSQPKYIENVNSIMVNESLSTIKDYFTWALLNDASSYLSEKIGDQSFDFYGKTLNDLKEQKPRNERVLGTVNRVLGEALGKLYVAEYFPKEAKETAVEMVENVRKAYENRINNLDWMSAETKVKAIEKLMGMTVKIGYPDEWKDYSGLAVSDTFYENILNSRNWNFKEDIVKIGENVDKTEWFMSPQTVNAYYNPLYNEIVFPAAILQPPFFDFKADAAVNYGGMGAVIGHEISHGFDDQGAKFDVNGNLENWWTDEDKSNFEERGAQLAAQYDAYEPLPGVFVNGKFTLGENIGDLGGVAAAFDGLQIHLDKTGDTALIDGMTPQQRFFVNWATIWRTKFRDEALKTQIKTDPHSPGMYRAVGPIVNVDGFYDTFGVKKGDKMYKEEADRVKIW